MPGRMKLVLGGVMMTPFLTTKILLAEPSVRSPSRSSTVSAASASTALWRSRQLASSDTDLMSQRSQRLSATVIAATPRSRCSGGGVVSGLDIMNTVGFTPFGKAWSRGPTPRVTLNYTYRSEDDTPHLHPT